MIILRTPKGWTGPKEVDGKPIEGTFRAHQVPVGDFAAKPEHLKILEDWMKSYKPGELFDESGRLIAELAELAPHGDRGAWAPIRTPMAGCCCATCACRTFATMPWR